MINCKYLIQPENMEGVCYCKHKSNPSEYEGNCYKKICPLGAEAFEILEENKRLENLLRKIKLKMNLIIIDIKGESK